MKKITDRLDIKLLDPDLSKALEKERKELEMEKSDFIRYLLSKAINYTKK